MSYTTDKVLEYLKKIETASPMDQELKGLIEQMEKSIFLQWFTDDVVFAWRDYTEQDKCPMTDEELMNVLEYAKNNHDCDYGITWEHIRTAIEYTYGWPEYDNEPENENE